MGDANAKIAGGAPNSAVSGSRRNPATKVRKATANNVRSQGGKIVTRYTIEQAARTIGKKPASREGNKNGFCSNPGSVEPHNSIGCRPPEWDF